MNSKQKQFIIVPTLLLSLWSVTLAAQPQQSNAHLDTKTVLTADAGSVRVVNDHVTVTCEGNVRMASAQNNSTLICQSIAADGKNDLYRAQASGGVKFSMFLPVNQGGDLVEYKVEITAQSAIKSGDIIKLIGGKTNRPQLRMTPTNGQSKDLAILVADVIEFYPDAQNLAQMVTARPTSFMKASGNAVFTAIRQFGTSGKKIVGTAPLITGMFENKPFPGVKANESSQVFHFENAGGTRPHLELNDLDPNVSDSATLTANSITYAPDAEHDWTLNASRNNSPSPIAAMLADGNVAFSVTRKGKTKATTATAKAPLGMANGLPVNQVWNGEAESLVYALEMGASKVNKQVGSAKMNHVVRLSKGRNGQLPHVLLVDKDTGKHVSEMTSERAFINMDSGEWGFISDDAGTEGAK
ncbi:MAG TPA: hypothetical protein VHV83_09400 [Armatimonadota bacterium]|nr:hypothetical protein [Armatimonadota bacterium]